MYCDPQSGLPPSGPLLFSVLPVQERAVLLFCTLISSMTSAVVLSGTSLRLPSVGKAWTQSSDTERLFLRLEEKIILHLAPLGHKGTGISHLRLSLPYATPTVHI